jgi:hypothetical protein
MVSFPSVPISYRWMILWFDAVWSELWKESLNKYQSSRAYSGYEGSAKQPRLRVGYDAKRAAGRAFQATTESDLWPSSITDTSQMEPSELTTTHVKILYSLVPFLNVHVAYIVAEMGFLSLRRHVMQWYVLYPVKRSGVTRFDSQTRISWLCLRIPWFLAVQTPLHGLCCNDCALPTELCGEEVLLLLRHLQLTFRVRGYQHFKDPAPVLSYVSIQHKTYLS